MGPCFEHRLFRVLPSKYLVTHPYVQSDNIYIARRNFLTKHLSIAVNSL